MRAKHTERLGKKTRERGDEGDIEINSEIHVHWWIHGTQIYYPGVDITENLIPSKGVVSKDVEREQFAKHQEYHLNHSAEDNFMAILRHGHFTLVVAQSHSTKCCNCFLPKHDKCQTHQDN